MTSSAINRILESARNQRMDSLAKGGGSAAFALLPPNLGLRVIYLERETDVSGHSGPGIVAGGIAFPDGSCWLRWYSDTPTYTFYRSPEQVAMLHGHDGATRVIITEEITAVPGASEVV